MRDDVHGTVSAGTACTGREAVETTAQVEAAKKQSEEREAATKAALGWSPITRLFAVLAAVLIAVNLYQNFFAH